MTDRRGPRSCPRTPSPDLPRSAHTLPPLIPPHSLLFGASQGHHLCLTKKRKPSDRPRGSDRRSPPKTFVRIASQAAFRFPLRLIDVETDYQSGSSLLGRKERLQHGSGGVRKKRAYNISNLNPTHLLFISGQCGVQITWYVGSSH